MEKTQESIEPDPTCTALILDLMTTGDFGVREAIALATTFTKEKEKYETSCVYPRLAARYC